MWVNLEKMTPEVYADKLPPRFGMNSSGSMSDEVVGIFVEHDSSKKSVALIFICFIIEIIILLFVYFSLARL